MSWFELCCSKAEILIDRVLKEAEWFFVISWRRQNILICKVFNSFVFTFLFLVMCINKISCQPIAFINCKSWNKILEVKNKGVVLLMEAESLRSSVSCLLCHAKTLVSSFGTGAFHLSVKVKHDCLYGFPPCLQSSSILLVRKAVKAAISLYSTY